MKLYTDSSCNIESLKILSTAEVYSLKIEVAIVNDTKEYSSLPTFEIADGSILQSSNASCRYICSICKKSPSLLDDSWLEWEITILQPSVSALLKIGKVESIPVSLKNCLRYLNCVLSQQTYLSGKNDMGLADVVVWSNLYPLFKASLLSEAADSPHLQKWLTSLKDHAALNKAFTAFAGDAKSDNLKQKLACNSVLSAEQTMFFMPVNVSSFSISYSGSSAENEETRKELDLTEEEISAAYNCWLKGQSSLPHRKPNKAPVLPIKGERNILITSALPYVNNIPHLGNIIGSVLSADVFARYCRVRGYNTLYVCGTDEYGTATETKAISLGVTPREICDKFNKCHSDIYDWFNISFDHFGRTTTDKQTEIAQDIFNKLYSKNLILTDSVEQLFCESCQRFLADRFVEGTCPFCAYEDARGDQCDKCGKLINAAELKQPQCKLCRATPRMRSSQHLFLDLPKLEKPLKEYLDKATSTGHWSNTAKVIANSWLKEGLKPRCITRDLKWGTPVPLEGFTDKVFYVWFDAPIGYLSITANYTDQWEQWWKQPDVVQLYQFMAKDNVPFHSIIFPACQIGSGDNYTVVNHLPATEYLNYEDVKFSKSRGVGVFGDDAKDTGLPSDIWRFYLLYLRPEGQDTYFSWSDLMLKINSELLNNLGNFVNRALSFVSNNFGGRIPAMTLEEGDKRIVAQVDHELKNYIQCMEKTKLRDAIKYMLNISRIGNQYIQFSKPWEKVKGSPEEKSRAGTVLGLSANICCQLCTLMEPYMPGSCAALKAQLNTGPRHHVLCDSFLCLLPDGHTIGKPAPLFTKIDSDLISNLKKKYAGRQSTEKETSPKKPKKSAEKDDPANCVSNGIDKEEIDSLEGLVTTQGIKVRELKSSKAPKPEVDKEVSVLLELKKRLAIAKGETPEPAKGKKKKK